MPSQKRLFISLFFVLLFFLFIPVVLLYSMGYRLGENYSLTPTGGLYVFYPESGAQVYLNGTLSDQTSLFTRGIFIDKLSSAVYDVEVKKQGYLSWHKKVNVVERRVAESYPYLIPEVISTSTVPRFITLGSGATVTNTLYGEVRDLFASSTATSTATLLKDISKSTSTTVIASSTGEVRKNIEISLEGKQVIASWKGGRDSTPFYFCDVQRTVCDDTLLVTEGDIKHVEFYPGRNDVILYSTKEGIFVTELDKREPQNTHKLLSGNLEFKESGQRIFIKEKTNYYELLFTASSTLVNPISI